MEIVSDSQEPAVRWYGIEKYIILDMTPAKLSYLLYLSMVGTYAHYFNMFLRDVGLNLSECGFITGMGLVSLALVAPLWGLLVDYTGRRKTIYFLLFTANMLAFFPVPFIASIVNPMTYINSTEKSINKSVMANENNEQSSASFSSSIFFTMLGIIMVAKTCISPLHSMIDAAVMNVIEVKHPQATFGEQRAFGAIGYGLGSFLSGVVVDHFGRYFEVIGFTKYTTIFLTFLPFALICLPTNLYLLNQMIIKVKKDDSNRKNEVNVFKLVFKTFQNFENFIFILNSFVTGYANMMLTAYLFILMEEQMHSPKSLMGLATLTQSIVQLLVFPFSDKLINLFGGPIASLEISIFSYCVRFIANSLITNPWLVLVTQTLHSIGFSLFWAAAMVYTQQIAPKEIYVTMFSIVSGTYLGFGGIIANILGGALYHKFGGAVVFRALGVFFGIWTIILILCFQGRGYIRRKFRGVKQTSTVTPVA